MFAYILGVNPDPYAGALALAVGFICICIASAFYLSNRAGRRDLELKHALAMKQQADHHTEVVHQSDLNAETKRIEIASRRDVDLAQVTEKSLLVSHQREEQPSERIEG